MADLVTEAKLLLMLALMLGTVAFPLVFLLSFVYDWLAGKYSKLPKILLLYLVTVFGIFVALWIIEWYLGVTIPEAYSALK